MPVPLKPQQNTTPPIEKYEEGCEYNREDDREDTGILDAKNTEEEASSRHESESLSSDSLEKSDNNNDDDNGAGAEAKKYYVAGSGDGGGDRNTGARGGSAECMGFLIPSELSETFGAMAKAKASSSTKSRKLKFGKS